MPLDKDTVKELPIYNPPTHKAGDMVQTRWDNKLTPAIVLDDMGRALLNPTQGEIIAIRKRHRKHT